MPRLELIWFAVQKTELFAVGSDQTLQIIDSLSLTAAENGTCAPALEAPYLYCDGFFEVFVIHFRKTAHALWMNIVNRLHGVPTFDRRAQKQLLHNCDIVRVFHQHQPAWWHHQAITLLYGPAT